MALGRTGARTFLDLCAKVCKLSHNKGFRLGLAQILGPEDALTLLNVFDPFCIVVDVLIAADDNFNRVDATAPSEGDGEDNPPV